jgi:hypothetical protein
MDITDTLDYDLIDPKTLTAVNTRELDAPRHGHEHHGVVYSNSGRERRGTLERRRPAGREK